MRACCSCAEFREKDRIITRVESYGVLKATLSTRQHLLPRLCSFLSLSVKFKKKFFGRRWMGAQTLFLWLFFMRFFCCCFSLPATGRSVALVVLRSQKEKRREKSFEKKTKKAKRKSNPISKSKKASQTHRVSHLISRDGRVYIHKKTREHASKRDLLSRRRYRHQPNQRSYLIRCALLKKKLFIYVTKK